MGKLYLCYDLRGIQSYIFKIPRLKYIVGGSALIDYFDRRTVPALTRENDWNLVYSAGGKGAFVAQDETQAETIRNCLVKQARKIGIDIRFGWHREYSEAANSTNRLFPYFPEVRDDGGHPCPESGLYPTTGKGPHSIVGARKWSRKPPEDGSQTVRMDRWFEEGRKLLDNIELSGASGQTLAFMRSADEEDDPQSMAGFQALGSRNRWAVIAMDGNDVGRQFREMAGNEENDDLYLQWLKDMSYALDDCSATACIAGIRRVLEVWEQDEAVRKGLEAGHFKVDDEIIIPIRPLVVGGDDITVLCHASYATDFVKTACEVFNQTSKERAAQVPNVDVPLWPGTDGELTISAGILYCGTSLPLATAIPYAHDLLSQAKAAGRAKQATRATAAPAFVDFEAVTESLLDTPRARRKRELEFRDGDFTEHTRIKLTRRPYAVSDLDALEQDLERLKLPTTMLHRILPGLRQGARDREVFYARLGKHHRALYHALDETNAGQKPSRWVREVDPKGRPVLKTDLIDMTILAKESRRMAEGTQ